MSLTSRRTIGDKPLKQTIKITLLLCLFLALGGVIASGVWFASTHIVVTNIIHGKAEHEAK